VELVLVPRGVGKLEIVVPNLFKEVERGQDVTVKFSILNSGTLVLRTVRPELDVPLEWEYELDPESKALLDGGEKTLFAATIRPPPDVDVGTYTVKMRVEGHSGIESVEAEEKDFTIRMAAESSLTGTAVLVAVLIVLVVGIAIASIKISRR